MIAVHVLLGTEPQSIREPQIDAGTILARIELARRE
jgi:hypothetical protein